MSLTGPGAFDQLRAAAPSTAPDPEIPRTGPGRTICTNDAGSRPED